MDRARRHPGVCCEILVAATLASGLAWPSAALGAARITKGPWVQRVTKDSAVVRIEVDPPGPVSLEWESPGGDAGKGTLASSEVRAFHAIPLAGLSPAARYAVVAHAGVASGGATKTVEFVTAPPDSSEQAIHFLAYGDNRTDPAAHGAVVRAMAGVPSDFLVHTGDFVEDGANPVQWQTFFDIEGPLLATRCLFSCVGNHELTDGSGVQYARLFGPSGGELPSGGATLRPEHFNATFRWGAARFFFINGMVGYRSTVDRTWLENALVAADAEPDLAWRIVVVHHGPWSSGPHGDNTRLHDAKLVDLMRAHAVDIVFAGHDHLYERGFGEGLAYVVTGGGGAPVYKVDKLGKYTQKVESVRHFVDVELTRKELRVTPTRIDGSVIERCALGKGRSGWDCGGASDAGQAAAPISVTPAPAASGSRCSCDVAGGGNSFGQAFAAGLLALAIGVRRASGAAWQRRRAGRY